ncbi:MAG: amidohydrolase family protein [Candidatus Lambdaproteobacteria bacterium]|nr:amidohydrolase family protein [Candidatus Lambdaproteobacteria bacterium]
MDYDIKIAGGTLVDGTGAPGVRGDVGIRGGRVVALGKAPGHARRTLAADGLVVAPGFVDIHTHYDAQVLWDRMMTISPWHGVTTVVAGNCGFGVAPTRAAHRELILRTLENVEGMSYAALRAGVGLDWPFETFGEYLDTVEARGTAINFSALLGHTPLRLYVMGEEATEREATDEEIRRMRALVREALEAGAIGFATSKAATHVGYAGKPVPSRAAHMDEIRFLAGALKEVGRGLVQATVGKELFHEEFAVLARETGRPVTWTALLSGMGGPGGYRRHLERTAELRTQGLHVVPQVTCRPLNFEYQYSDPFIFGSMDVFDPVFRTDRAGRIALYRDPGFRRRVKERSAPDARSVFQSWYERTVIATNPQDPGSEEHSVGDVARARGVHPVDLALDIALQTDLTARFRMAVMNFDEGEVRDLLTDPHCVLGLSDAGAHASQLCDACYSTHLLGHWVRETGTLSLEQGVRMLTSTPAALFGLTDRGRLAEGLPADVTVFDPATVGAGGLKRVHDLPHAADRLISEAAGIHAVLVNGTVVRFEGRDALDVEGPLPGRVLRGGHAA